MSSLATFSMLWKIWRKKLWKKVIIIEKNVKTLADGCCELSFFGVLLQFYIHHPSFSIHKITTSNFLYMPSLFTNSDLFFIYYPLTSPIKSILFLYNTFCQIGGTIYSGLTGTRRRLGIRDDAFHFNPILRTRKPLSLSRKTDML